MSNVSIHSTKALASALARQAKADAKAANDALAGKPGRLVQPSLRQSGGALIERQIQELPLESPLIDAVGNLKNLTRRLGRHRARARRVLEKVQADGDESYLHWKIFKADLEMLEPALNTASQAIACEAKSTASAFADLHARAAAAVGRTLGPGMPMEGLTEEKIKLASLALRSGAISLPKQFKPVSPS